jgi:hypothetical protein
MGALPGVAETATMQFHFDPARIVAGRHCPNRQIDFSGSGKIG